MQNVINALETKTMTLKAAKAEFEVIADCKTIAQAVEVLTAEMNKPVLTLREQVKAEVLELLDLEISTTFKIGKLLSEVKPDFEKGADFLDWCKKELSLGKASVFNYLKIHNTFGDTEVFKNVSMRVLRTMAMFKEFELIEDKCAALAEAGKLDSKSLNEIIDSLKPAKAEPVKTEPDNTVEPEKTTELPEDDYQEDEDDSVPFDTASTTVELPKATRDTSSFTEVSEPAKEDNEQVQELMKLVQELREQLKEAREDSQRSQKVASAPMLPQFKNPCLYARLGLSQSESGDKKRVKSAYRELVKLGYGEGHTAHDAIKEAFTELSK